MGIYDRDYYREEPKPLFSVGAPKTVITALILINVGIWIVDGFLSPGGRWLSDHMALQADSLLKPWLWWQLITYGFAHSPFDLRHILFNMLTLFFLGRDVELLYGRKEFLRLYFVLIVVSGIVWAVAETLEGKTEAMAYGASGAVAGVVVLFAANFPRRMLLLFFLIPVPAWAVGVLLIGFDVLGAMNAKGSNIAHWAHLGGAAFGFLYFYYRWNFGRLLDWLPLPRFRRPRRRFRVHYPDREDRRDRDLSEQVDQILEKISREGEESLTRKERRILNNASREYQKRQR